ncbi:MAG: YhcH/YjgK/YiaL family protein [Dehalococcoidia bacterium]|nr:YhcH/YjgK/YiaL family protein [Dehalococcoidia bacterium]
MILDSVDNSVRYESMGKRFAHAFTLLRNGNLAAKEPGSYEVDGRNLYYMVQQYNTKPSEERRFESHRVYADIQAVFSGREAMGVTKIAGLEVQTPHDEAKDIMFFTTPADYTELKMEAGDFVVLFPGEVHMPQCQWDGPAQVVKVVFKVKIAD